MYSADETVRILRRSRLWSLLATSALTGGIAAGILASPISAADADPGSPFASISGAVSAGGHAEVAGLPVPAAHPHVIMRLTQTGSSQVDLYVDGEEPDVSSGDVVWSVSDSLDPGDTPSASAENLDGVNGATFSAEFFDEPTAPVSYSGVSSIGSTSAQNSILPFFTPGTAPYVASVSVSGGAIQVTGGNGGYQTFEDPGQYSLGTISDGNDDVLVEPVAGPQAQWTIAISPEPITISATQFNNAWSQPGVVNTLGFSVDGDTHLTGLIENASGTVVRTLASGLSEGNGAHTLVWDGRDSNGNPVPTGTYTAVLSSNDPLGNISNAGATIGIDSTPPTVSLAQTTLHLTQAVDVGFADQGSGVATGSITIDGAHKQVLHSGETSLSYGPRRWTPGRHQVVAVAVDRAGNRTEDTLSFVAQPPPSMPIQGGVIGVTRARPAIVGLVADGSQLLGGVTGRHPTESTRGHPFGRLHWTTWTATDGRAQGAEWINNCSPSCGGGVYRAFRATVHVYDPSATGVFQRMKITARLKRPKTYAASYAEGGWGWN
jgi:hypothetical protein